MGKKVYTVQDIENHLREHPEFEKISGMYSLSMAPHTLSLSKHRINFEVTESDFQMCIQQIIEAVLELTPVKAASAPKEWAPIPSVDRETILQRYQQNPEIYLELIQDDPNIILIQKTSDTGKSITWLVEG